MNSLKRQSAGFTLIELAIVLTIVGVLTTGALFGLGEFRSVQHVKEGVQKMDKIRTQLLLFGQVNKFLPCPDTDYDGFENRNGKACSKVVGTLPYVNLGLQREDAQDAWNNFIRYAINRNANNDVFICDLTESASYFCNPGFGQEIQFSLTETPPLSGNLGNGNYTVNNASNSPIESASIILVAYNKDGQRTLLNCNDSSGATLENCDENERYQIGVKSSDEAAFYDDIVLGISGYDIKNALLGKTIVWDDYPTSSGLLVPTYEDFDITADDEQSEIATGGDDVVIVNRNVDSELNLGAGDDYIVIGNNLNESSDLKTESGNDTVYIVGFAKSRVLLGDGDDVFVLGTNLTKEIDAGSGNDKVWVQGDVESGSTFHLGTGDDLVWLGKKEEQEDGLFTPSGGGVYDRIYGDEGYDILILENMSKAEWEANSVFQSLIVGFELVLFSPDTITNEREYVSLP
ncbi:hypothetical protein MNBD_GAMMA03-1337 [hydrothermal vent metagenome]|uniref:Uncharacterized protein n=1 Tax=hydrothermal vent metagenome TaxID=652676 RepID=A0A3B0VVC2_9ZZZZ